MGCSPCSICFASGWGMKRKWFIKRQAKSPTLVSWRRTRETQRQVIPLQLQKISTWESDSYFQSYQVVVVHEGKLTRKPPQRKGSMRESECPHQPRKTIWFQTCNYKNKRQTDWLFVLWDSEVPYGLWFHSAEDSLPIDSSPWNYFRLAS